MRHLLALCVRPIVRFSSTIQEFSLVNVKSKGDPAKPDLPKWPLLQNSRPSCRVAARQRVLALPSEAAALCNPSDPEHRRLALEQWVTRFLAFRREQEAAL